MLIQLVARMVAVVPATAVVLVLRLCLWRCGPCAHVSAAGGSCAAFGGTHNRAAASAQRLSCACVRTVVVLVVAAAVVGVVLAPAPALVLVLVLGPRR